MIAKFNWRLGKGTAMMVAATAMLVPAIGYAFSGLPIYAYRSLGAACQPYAASAATHAYTAAGAIKLEWAGTGATIRAVCPVPNAVHPGLEIVNNDPLELNETFIRDYNAVSATVVVSYSLSSGALLGCNLMATDTLTGSSVSDFADVVYGPASGAREEISFEVEASPDYSLMLRCTTILDGTSDHATILGYHAVAVLDE
jgi:hypothetical protein